MTDRGVVTRLEIAAQRKPRRAALLVAAAATFAALYLCSRYNYLLFHTLAELFAVVIGGCIFAIAWNARSFLQNGYLLLLGAAFGSVAVIDLAHSLTYRGMAIFPDGGANLPTQLWIAARYVQALSLASAPLLLGRVLRPSLVFLAYALLTLLLLGATVTGWFPDCYVEGVGLTPFKRVSEYLICLILAATIAWLLRNRNRFHEQVFPSLVGSIGFTIAAELMFTLYVDVYDVANLLGHFLKIVAFACVYQAIIKTGLTQPYALLLREVKEREERLHVAQEAGRIGSFEWDIERGTVTTEGMGAVYGITASEVSNTLEAWRRRVHPEDLPRVEREATAAIAGDLEYNTEYRCLRPDGSIGWVGARGRIQRDAAGRPLRMIGVNIDITDRKRAEEARRESELRLRAMGDNLPESAVYQRTRDRRGRWVFLYMSAGIQRLTGVSAVDVLRDPETLHQRIVPPYLERLIDAETRSAEDLSDVDMDIPVRTLDGNLRWIRLHSRPRRLPDGDVVWDGVQTDITERKEFQAELERLVGERTAKLQEMVGELQHVSYAIVHDMRAPLRALSGYALLLENATDAERALYSQRIAAAALRMDLQIRDALSYTKAVLQEVTLEPVALLPLLRDILVMYPNFAPDKADIILADDMPRVWGNEALLTQCFSNLLGNAVKFSKPGVKPEIRVWAEPSPGQTGAPPEQNEHGRSALVRVYVSDNGIGIPEFAVGRLFGMFERGAGQEHGNGIGLAIVRKVVERMGGSVGVESEVGKGSRFWVELSRAAAP